MYNSSYSLRIAGQFRDCYPRASYFFQCMYGTNIYYSAQLFQYDQKRWNLFKKCVVRLDSILASADYSVSVPADITLLKQKVRHILGLKPPNVTKLPKNDTKVVDRQLELPYV